MSTIHPLKNTRWPLLACLAVVVLTSTHCGYALKPGGGTSEPLIRVGIMNDVSALYVVNHSEVTIYDEGMRPVVTERQQRKWRLDVSEVKPAEKNFMLAVKVLYDRDEAEDLRDLLRRKGLASRVEIIGEPMGLGRRRSLDTRTYRVLIDGIFKSQGEAETYARSIRHLTRTNVVPQVTKDPTGAITLRIDGTDKYYRFRDKFWMRCDELEIKNVSVGAGFHWAGKEDRTYRGDMAFVVDQFGGMTIVNILPVESYLRGVVPSEMPKSFPAEALKAQAIAARTEVLSKMNTRHLEEPYEVCDDVHCQVYSGRSKEGESTNRAVAETAGQVMLYDGALCEVYYASNCGGHSENNADMWGTVQKPYLVGVADHKGSRSSGGSLRDESIVRKWVTSRPNVFCNTVDGRAPEALNYTKKYFRWEVEYTRGKLEKLIASSTGVKFGTLEDLRPGERGVSGRLKWLEVVGSQRTFRIETDLAIRRALSKNTLWSSCIVIDLDRDRNGKVKNIRLKGAGFGHGVGMCQTGAAMMAVDGHTHDQILSHYYRNMQIQSLYQLP